MRYDIYWSGLFPYTRCMHLYAVCLRSFEGARRRRRWLHVLAFVCGVTGGHVTRSPSSSFTTNRYRSEGHLILIRTHLYNYRILTFNQHHHLQPLSSRQVPLGRVEHTLFSRHRGPTCPQQSTFPRPGKCQQLSTTVNNGVILTFLPRTIDPCTPQTHVRPEGSTALQGAGNNARGRLRYRRQRGR